MVIEIAWMCVCVCLLSLYVNWFRQIEYFNWTMIFVRIKLSQQVSKIVYVVQVHQCMEKKYDKD
jgi:hypothetical protein